MCKLLKIQKKSVGCSKTINDMAMMVSPGCRRKMSRSIHYDYEGDKYQVY